MASVFEILQRSGPISMGDFTPTEPESMDTSKLPTTMERLKNYFRLRRSGSTPEEASALVSQIPTGEGPDPRDVWANKDVQVPLGPSPAPRAAPVAAPTPAPPRQAVQTAPSAPQMAEPAAAAPAPAPVAAGEATDAQVAAMTPLQRRAHYERQLTELEKPTDYSALQEQIRGQQESAGKILQAALLAGAGPSATRGAQGPLLKQALEMIQPRKVEGGVITPTGEVQLDPAFQQQKKIDSLQRRIQALDDLERKARSDREREDIQRERNDILRLVAEARADKLRGGGGDGVPGLGNLKGSKHVYNLENGTKVFMSPQGRLWHADDTGSPVAFEGKRNELFPTTPVPAQVATKLTNYSEQVNKLANMQNAFKDDYTAAIPGMGRPEMAARRVLPGLSVDKAKWWADYNEWAAQVRNQLFGSALTRSELEAFRSFAITENDKAEFIRDRLNKQQEIAQRAHDKLQSFYRRVPGGDPSNPAHIRQYQSESGAAPSPGAGAPLSPAERERLNELRAKKGR